jgi:hypothetical protein
MLMLFFSLVLP